MSIKKKLTLGLSFFVAGLAVVLVTCVTAFASLTRGFGGIVERAESSVEDSKVSVADAKFAVKELGRVATQVPKVGEDIQQTRLRVQILERKITGVSETLEDLVEAIEETCSSLPEGDQRDQFEWLSDDVTDLQETVRKEALIGLANASSTMARSAEGLDVEIQAIQELTQTLDQAASRSEGALASSNAIAHASGGFQQEINTTRRTLFWILMALASAATIGMLAFMRFLVRSLRSANKIAEGITAGNLNQAIETERRDEIGLLLRNMDDMQASMRDSIESLEAARAEDLANTKELEAAHARQQEQADELRRVSAEIQSAAEVKAREAALEAERSRDIELRVDRLLEVVEEVASGNLNVTIADSGDDAVGRIATGFRSFVESLRGNFSVIAGTAQRVAQSSAELTETSSGMYARAEGTSSRAALVSTTSSEVSSAIDSVAAASQQMAESAGEIASQTAHVAAMAHDAVSHVSRATEAVHQMDEATCEIRAIIQMITGIAEQTNLLALNATIEAARAGESGKGFAVVANEVKSLAHETARATEDIVGRISAVEGRAVATCEAIDLISDVIEQISEIQSSVAGAIDEQTATTTEISLNMVNAAQGSSNITSEVGELADASKSALRDADTSQASSEEMAQVAAELNALVSQFQL